jgi:uncharacterized protein with GYD domain
MPRYLFAASYTPQGVAGIKSSGGSARRDVIARLAQGMGGRLETFDFAFGGHDVYTVCELPDNAAAAAVAMAVNASGAVALTTTVLLTPEEVDDAAKRSVDYTPPGG